MEMDGDADATQAGEMFASRSVIPLLTSMHLFEVLAPDFVRSPIWLLFKSDQIKMREKFTSLLYQTVSYAYLFLVAGTLYLSGNCH